MNGWHISHHDSIEKISQVLQRNLISKDVLIVQNTLISEDRDLNLVFKDDSSIVATFRIWIDREPPFRHVALIFIIAFEMGVATEILHVTKKGFGVDV